TTNEYFDAYKYSQITEDQLRTELMLKGLTLKETDILIKSKQIKWGMPDN
ncbi:unnamed protein product, partial [marine sediment metagenome]